jgi:shikimate dehydrogenase
MIIPRQKDLFAVVGNPVSHSLSPVMMNVAFADLGVDAVYVALQLDEAVRDLKTIFDTGFRGLSVTLPHKETAFSIAARVDETARMIGAVNTLKHSEDGWEGRNTDWTGANRAIEKVVAIKGKKALVIGAGGVARAVVFGLKRGQAEVTLANRSVGRGSSLAKSFECGFIPLADLDRARSEGLDFDIVVQCTSVGLAGTGPASPVSASFFRSGMVVMDTVYRPLVTPFLKAANEAGCKTISGLEMLLYQGVAQLEWWLERSIPSACIEAMKESLVKAVAHVHND